MKKEKWIKNWLSRKQLQSQHFKYSVKKIIKKQSVCEKKINKYQIDLDLLIASI